MPTVIPNETARPTLARLLLRRDALRTRLNAISADAHRGLDPNSTERAVELENAEVLNEIARVTSEELHRIESTIADRLAESTADGSTRSTQPNGTADGA